MADMLFDPLFYFFIAMLYTFFYPWLIFYGFVMDMVGLLYGVFVPLINLVILMFNFPVMILTQFIILPPAWTVLLYLSITISMSVRIYHWFMTLIRFIPGLKSIIGGRE